jgi:hypothetical protein
MRKRYGGNAERARRESSARVARVLAVPTHRWTAAQRGAFENLALVLDLVPGLSRWPVDERVAIGRLARAKADSDEIRFLRLLRRCGRLRRAILRLGSVSPDTR